MAKNVLSLAERFESKFANKLQKTGKSIRNIKPGISTGSLQLDCAIGKCKGYPEGAIVEVYGAQHSGKTLMGYLAIAESQKRHPDRMQIIFDLENCFEHQADFASQVGVDIENLYVFNPSSAEETFDMLNELILGDVELDKDGNVKKIIKPGNLGIVMLDSVTTMCPAELMNKEMQQSKRIAALAAVMSEGLRKISSSMSKVKHVGDGNIGIFFFINQIRTNPNQMFGNPETRTGGKALAFYDTLTLKVAKVRNSEERDSKGRIIGHKVKIKFEKNKVGQIPENPLVFKLLYNGTGVDNDFEMFSVAEMNGLIAKGEMAKTRSSEERKIKRGRWNFILPRENEDETAILLDESIEDFKEEDFSDVLAANPKIKEKIIKLIDSGEFFVDDDSVEEVYDDEGETTPEGKIKGKKDK